MEKLKVVMKREEVAMECPTHGQVQGFYRVLLGKKKGPFCPLCEQEKKESYESGMDAKAESDAASCLEYKSEIPAIYKNKTLADYTPTNEAAAAVFSQIKTYVQVYKQLPNMDILMCGGTGTGKTHLACALMKELIQRYNVSGRYIRMSKLMLLVKESWRRDAQRKESEIYADLNQFDVLVIDEVGMSYQSETEQIIFFNIMGDRHDSGKATILISNVPSGKDLKNLVGERVFDRVKESGGMLLGFDWPSYRGNLWEETRRKIKDAAPVLAPAPL